MEKDAKIIIAEDDTGHFQLVKRNLWLSCFDHEILNFRDGQDVLDFLFAHKDTEQGRYVLLLDIKMPKINGHEVLRRIRDDPKLKNISVIMLTTTSEDSEIQKCYKLGCSFYMVKPVDYRQFMEAVDSLGKFFSLDSVRLAPKN